MVNEGFFIKVNGNIILGGIAMWVPGLCCRNVLKIHLTQTLKANHDWITNKNMSDWLDKNTNLSQPDTRTPVHYSLSLWLWLLSHEVVTINPLVLSSNIYLHLWSDWGTGFTQWWWKSQTNGDKHFPCYFLVCMKISVSTKMRILRQTEEIKLCQCHLQSKL